VSTAGGNERRAGRERGFTLVELLIAMGLIGVIFALFSVVVSSTLRHGGQVEEQTVLQHEVRGTVERLAQDLRQAYSGVDDTSPIESISATQIQFLSPDRQQPFHLRRLAYRASGTSFQSAIATSSDTDGAPWTIPSLSAWRTHFGSLVGTNVFTYLDENGVATADPAQVKTVVIQVTVATSISPNRQYTYKTSVTLRADI
jgi:prepilin-type N-terminal cleavage/methylation domain-containing protein